MKLHTTSSTPRFLKAANRRSLSALSLFGSTRKIPPLDGTEPRVVPRCHGGIEALTCVLAALEGHEAGGHEENVELCLFLRDGVDGFVDLGNERDVGCDEVVGSGRVRLA